MDRAMREKSVAFLKYLKMKNRSRDQEDFSFTGGLSKTLVRSWLTLPPCYEVWQSSDQINAGKDAILVKGFGVN